MFGLVMLIKVIEMMEDRQEEYESVPTFDYSSSSCDETQTVLQNSMITARSWMDYFSNDYCSTYETFDQDFLDSRQYRSNYRDNLFLAQDTYWRAIYQDLADHDFEKLKPLADTLWSISEEYDLNRDEFANMVVSFVQDIPYSFILDEERCSNQDPGFSCVQDERLGLLSPLEFLHTLKGDCDTRTVLLYALFKHFNYQPKIVNSWKYLHSMLLLDVTSSGDYLKQNGQRFYFWETTSTGWQAGDVPPDMADLSSWRIILD